MNRNATSNAIHASFVAGLLLITTMVLSGCAQDTSMRSTSESGMSTGSSSTGSSSTGIGNITGGAEAKPTAEPGVTPGKKP